MSTLYETLNDIIGEDISQQLNLQQIQDVHDKIEDKLRLKIGDKAYQDLETYMLNNKDDVYLKSLTTLMVMNLGGLGQAMKHAKVDTEKIETVLGYKILFRMYEVLRLSSFDAEKSIFNL